MNMIEKPSSDRSPARGANRASMFLMSTIAATEVGAGTKARIRNLSESGMMADCEKKFAPGQEVYVDLRGIGKVKGNVAWYEDGRIGVAFDEPIDPHLTRAPVGKGVDDTMPHYLKQLNEAVHLRPRAR